MEHIIKETSLSNDGFHAEFSVVQLSEAFDECLRQNESINSEMVEVEDELNDINDNLRELEGQAGRYTNEADLFDCTMAVASGLLCGFMDSFFVGEFDFAELKADSNKQVNKFIEFYARKRGYKGEKGLAGAICFLEKKFPVEQDNVWKGLGISSTRLHHLEDFAHHPTILGLVSSIAVTFFRIAEFDRNGQFRMVLLETGKKDLAKIWAPIVISGVLRWLVYLAESKYTQKTSKELPKPIHKLIVALSYSPAIIEVLKVADNWFGHFVSDMGGSKGTSGGGMGIPGIFISFLKEASSLPFLNNTQLPKYVSDLYSKDKWDFRSETAIMNYAGKQVVPVILNELLVRIFYFIRRLILEYRKTDSWQNVDWSNVVPWRNRTITRMMTVASGTFVAIDATDAAIRAAAKSGGEPSLFFGDMVLRINFVGIGRFAVAIGADTYMGYRLHRYHTAMDEAERAKKLLEFYHEGLCQLRGKYDDSAYLDFVLDMERGDYKQAFEKSSELARMRGEERRLKDKADIYAYFTKTE